MEEVGKVTHYFNKIGVAAVVLSKPLKIGDKIKIKGKTTNFEQVVESMQIEHKPIEIARKGDVIGLKVKDRVREKDFVYKIIE